MSRIDIELLGAHLWLTILICLVALALLFLYYRRTTPPLTAPLRWLLIILRGLAMIALFFALAQPILTLTEIVRHNKNMAVLIDRSRSMNLPLNTTTNESRLSRALDLLDNSIPASLAENLDIDYYSFAESLDVSEAGINLSGFETNPGWAVTQLKQSAAVNPYDYILLLSDGRATEGENLPDLASSMTQPVYTIAVGDSSRVDDIALADLEYNEVIYTGRKTEIKATIAQQGKISDNLQLRLSQGAKTLTQKMVSSPGDGKRGQHPLTFTPSTPGRMILDIEVLPADMETNRLNNRRKFAVRVLKSKLNILIYSSSLNQEYAFLNRFLKSSDDYELTRIIDASGGDRIGDRFPNTQEKLNSFDIVIMIDPNISRIESHYDRLVSYLSDRGGSLMIVMGEEYARSAPGSRIESLVPLAIGSSTNRSIQYGRFHLVPDQRMIFHPAVKLGDTREEIVSQWANQPPFTIYLPVDSLRARSVALGYIEGEYGQRSQCGMAFSRKGAGKVLASAVAPFWHWAFFPVGVGGDASIYKDLMAGTIRWLTISDESDRINFKPVKEVFQSGEEVAFNGSAHDEGFRPIEKASGDLVIISEDGDSVLARIIPHQNKAGKYVSRVGVLPPGTYTYRAELQAESVRLGRFDGKFAVDDIDRETALTEVDWTNLAQTSKNSGGIFVSYHDITPIVEAIDMTRTTVEETRDIRLWNNLILLLIIIISLSVEWFIRKRRQLL